MLLKLHVTKHTNAQTTIAKDIALVTVMVVVAELAVLVV